MKLDTIGFLKIHYLTASLRALPALNAGTLEAAILISLPVCGLRPLFCSFCYFSDQILFVCHVNKSSK